MPKGHSLLEPRIIDLERVINQLSLAVADLQQRLNTMNEAFSRGALPKADYDPRFTRWTNGR